MPPLEIDNWDVFGIVIYIVMFTVGPIIVSGITGGVSGKLTRGARVGKGTLVGMGVGLLSLAVLWAWILAGPEPYNGDLVVTVIPLTNLAGIVVTVILVWMTRNKVEN